MPEVVTGENESVVETENTTGSTTEPSPGSAETEQSAAATAENGKPKDMTDAVQAALEGRSAEQSPSSKKEPSEEDDSAGTKDEKDEAAEGADPGDDLSEADLQRLNAKTKKRINKLLGQVKTQGADLERLRPAAESFERMRSFVDNAGLDAEDVNTGFEIMRLMKNDPEAAWEKVLPIVQKLAEMVGAGKLPEDLANQVQRGEITPEVARETARLRASRNLTRHRDTRQQERAQTAEQTAAQQQNAQKVFDVISSWENQWKSTDPDYAKKSEMVQERLQLALDAMKRKGEPITPDVVKTTLDTILKAVNDRIKAFSAPPRPQPTRNTPSSNNGRQPVAPAPKNFGDAIGAALLK